MKRKLLVLVFGLSFLSVNSFSAITLDFEDLAYEQHISGTNYAGLTWEFGNEGYDGREGWWVCPPLDHNYPNSGTHNITNAWGSTLIGIQFPYPVNVMGAYFAAQGSFGGPTTGVRVHGYLNGNETIVSGWFNDIDEQPDWFSMNLQNVDRIVIESVPTDNGGGWYGMDDLIYEIPEPTTLLLLGLGGLLLRRKYRR